MTHKKWKEISREPHPHMLRVNKAEINSFSVFHIVRYLDFAGRPITLLVEGKPFFLNFDTMGKIKHPSFLSLWNVLLVAVPQIFEEIRALNPIPYHEGKGIFVEGQKVINQSILATNLISIEGTRLFFYEKRIWEEVFQGESYYWNEFRKKDSSDLPEIPKGPLWESLLQGTRPMIKSLVYVLHDFQN